MSITINDVANEAGVSKSTVSKVLNNWSSISPETAAKVNAAIKKLHYIPNSRAVSFARQSTQNIVYLTSLAKDTAYQNPHMFDIMCGVHHELTRRNYTLTLVDISEEAYPGERAIQEINRRSADGLIIHGSVVNEELAKHILAENVPHIIIGHPTFENRLCWVDTDHSLAGEYAASHMLACGYTDVLFIGGKKSDTISNQRIRGFSERDAEPKTACSTASHSLYQCHQNRRIRKYPRCFKLRRFSSSSGDCVRQQYACAWRSKGSERTLPFHTKGHWSFDV